MKEWLDGRSRKQLPIDDSLDRILDILESNQVVIVEAETGAGKTTRLPQAVLLRNKLSGTRGKIFMTLPRRAAVRWNGKHISREMGEEPGGVVGWRLYGEEPVVSDKTRLVLSIDQSLANRIMRNNKLPEGTLIIDEAHERNIATDMLLMMIKEKLPESPNTKVIITSATIDTEKFSEYFNNAPVEKIKGRCFPVSTEVRTLEYAEHHSSGATAAAMDVADRFIRGRLMVPATNGQEQEAVDNGTVAVLLPGREDISNAKRVLEQHLMRREEEVPGISNRIEIVTCSGESSPEELDKAQSPVSEGKLRFVVSTEIIRSSVTIESLLGVIDSLQIKRLIVDHKGVAHLKKVPVSRAEADQAKGRAGRTRPGFYIPISFKDEYNSLKPYPEPAILREPIMNVALQISNMGRSIREVELIDKPDTTKIDTAIQQLKLLGCLDEDENITEEGKLIVNFPIDPERAKMLIVANKLGVLPEAMIVAATIEEEGFFFHPKTDNERDKAYNERRKWSDGHGDFIAIVNAYRQFKLAEEEIKEAIREARRNGESVDGAEKQLREWCQTHNINFKRIRIVENTILQLRDEINHSSLRLENRVADIREYDPELVLKAVLSGHVNDVSVFREGYGYESDRGSFKLSYGSVCPRGRLVLTGGSLSKVSAGRGSGHILLSDMASPIKHEWLEELYPHLCHREMLGNIRYNPAKDEVEETARLYFNGREITRLEVVSENNEAASEVFARWLADNPTLDGESSLGAVLRKNTLHKIKLERINIKNGSVLFSKLSISDFTAYYKEKLHGARSVAEISDPQVLLMPEPDEETRELVELVETENPDDIEICGHKKAVEYQLGKKPRVKINSDEERDFFQQLPDKAVGLPGGRNIVFSVTVRLDGRTIESENIDEVKEAIRTSQNYEQWVNWRDRPVIPPPNLYDFDSSVPDITEVQYGNCVLTGEPLQAYGVVNVRLESSYSRSNSYSIHGRTGWYWNRDDAELARQKSIKELAQYHEARKKEMEREEIRREREELTNKCHSLRSSLNSMTLQSNYYPNTDENSRREVANLLYQLRYPPEDAEECRGLIDESAKMLERVSSKITSAEKNMELNRIDKERINMLMCEQYACCPLCGKEFNRVRECDCIQAREAETGLVKASYTPDGKIIIATRILRDDYGSHYLKVEAESDHNIPELSEITTEMLYHPPREDQEKKGASTHEDPKVKESGDNLDRPPTGEELSELLARFGKK